MVERKLRGFTGYYFAIAEGTDTLPEFIKIIVAQDFLEEKYKRYDMRVLMDELPAFEECKFVMMFVANGIHWKLTHSCIDYRGEIASSEIGKMIELIEAKINSPIEVKKVEVKAEDYKPIKCPCCNATLNTITFKGNDSYIKCEYCNTILMR